MVEQFIADSQRQLDAQRATGAPPAPASDAAPGSAPTPLPPASPADPSSGPASLSPAASAPAAPSSSEIGASPPSSSWPLLRIAGVATAGVGVVLLGTAIGEGVAASSLSNQVSQISSQHGTWTPQAQSDYDSGKSAATAATALYVTGAIVLAGGAVMTWLGWPKSPSTTAAVAPTPGGASMSFITRF